MIAIDMNMPKNCIECRFGQGECGFCHAKTKNFVGYVYQSEDEGRPDWCPLVEVDSPNFDGTFLNPDDYVRVGDIIDCLSKVFCSNEDLIHVEGLIEWAMGKRAIGKQELWDSWERQFEEEEVLDE